jgi:mycothiol synthase
MPTDLMPVRVDPATADRAFWTRYHAFRRIEHSEMTPDDPLPPDDVVETRMKRPDPFDMQHYYELAGEAETVSVFHAENVTRENPEYESNKHLFWTRAYVRPDARRRGAATSWLAVAVALMHELGSTVLGMSADRESAHGFAKSIGATPRMTEVESRLKLSEVDWDLMRRWVDEGARRSPHTRMEIVDGPLPDSALAEFARQRSVLLNTMPFEGLDHGEIIVTPERVLDFYARAASISEVIHNVITWDPDGTIPAMTDVTWAPYRRTVIEQQFTGVRPDARGRGLGKWIKAAMVLHVRDLYPDAEWITTWNAHSNGPMLKINRSMGFKPYRTAVEYQVSRDELEARLRR